jgi:hypothetical protein
MTSRCTDQSTEELFGWRDELMGLPPDAELTPEAFTRQAFGEYLLRRSDDPPKYPRAPWDVVDE